MPQVRRRAGWLSLLLAAVALAGQAGCGAGDSDRPTPSTSASCAGPATPRLLPDDGLEDTHSEAKDHPRITGGKAITWTKATGRFQVTLHNGTCASWQDTDLRFNLLDIGFRPETTKLEYQAGSTWKRLSMHWWDTDEPEELESSALPVDFAPGQTRTYDFRITLPKQPNVRSFGLGARLDSAANGAYEWASSYTIRSYTGVHAKLTPPPSITPLGGWREFQVEVWTDRKLSRAARLGLATMPMSNQVVNDNTVFEEFRSGAWHPMDRAQPTTADFPLVPGRRERFRFRVKVGGISGQEDGRFGLHAQVRLAGEPVYQHPLARDGRPVKLILPTMRVVQPAQRPKQAGETAEFRVTVENRTNVAYPAQRLNFRILPTPPIGRIDYRAENEQAWKPLPISKHAEFGDIQLPALPDGFRRTYIIRVTTDQPPDQAMNWYATLQHDLGQPAVQLVSGHL